MIFIAFCFDFFIVATPLLSAVAIGYIAPGWIAIPILLASVVLMLKLAQKFEPPKGPFMKRVVGIYDDTRV